MPGTGFGKTIVDPSGEINGGLGRELLCSGCSMRKHLNVDAGLIHRAKPHVSDFGQEIRHGRFVLAGWEVCRHFGIPIVFLKRDNRRIVQHEEITFSSVRIA
jgi:hypothetical protein